MEEVDQDKAVETLPAFTEPVKEPEPDAPFWFFKCRPPLQHKTKPVEEPSRPSGGFRLSAETRLGNLKPSPAFVLPKYSSQASLDKPLLADIYAGPDVMVVEEDPAGKVSAEADSSVPPCRRLSVKTNFPKRGTILDSGAGSPNPGSGGTG